MLTTSEENYLKAIYKISQKKGVPVSTNDLARELSTSAASVTDMIKKLNQKSLVSYQPYQGTSLTDQGSRSATMLVRGHRIWEAFLVQKLNYGWDEVHDMAEQLEHIRSEDLVDRLEEFLGFPRFDPHGEPIPDRKGKFTLRSRVLLSSLEPGDHAEVIGVALHDSHFLKFLGDMHIEMGSNLEVMDAFDYDASMRIRIESHPTSMVSPAITQNIYVKKH